MVNTEKVMANLIVDLIRHFPFYGHIITQLPRIIVPADNMQVNTFAVGKSKKTESLANLYVNDGYINHLFDNNNDEKVNAHLKEVLKHEIYHLIFGHLSIDMPNREKFNTACECSVNSFINRNNLIIEDGFDKAGVFAEDFNLPSKESVYFYYKNLPDNPSAGNQSGTSDGESDDNGKPSKGKGKGSGKSKNGGISKPIDSHEPWELMKNDKLMEDMIKDVVRQSAEICKKTGNWGDVPAEVMTEVQNAFIRTRPAIPWQILVKNFLASASENLLDYTMKRKSKRYGIRPGTKKEDMLNLAIGVDSSGSVYDEMIELFFGELYWVSKTNSIITIFEADAKIQREYPFRDWDGISVQGRGGTDLEPILKEVSDRKFDALIYFTDMEAPTIETNYNIPIMWVINNSHHTSRETMPYKDGIFLKLNNDGDGFEFFD